MVAPPDFKAPVADGVLAGWVSGRGDPVLLLHGGPGLSDYTEGLADELGSTFTVYRYQQRGLVPSTTAGPFDIATQMRDGIAVLDALQVDRAWLVGHSWGGHLALFLASTYPERFLGALMVDPLGAVGDGGEQDLGENLVAGLSAEERERAEELDQRAMAAQGTEDEAREGLRIVWPYYFADPALAPPMPDLSSSVESYSETFESIHEHMDRKALVETLPLVTIPCAFVLGLQSPIPPIHGYRTANLIPGAVVHELDNCGHFVWMERPGETLRILRQLAKV